MANKQQEKARGKLGKDGGSDGSGGTVKCPLSYVPLRPAAGVREGRGFCFRQSPTQSSE